MYLVAIFEDKENAPVANTRKTNARVSFVQPMDLSATNQSQQEDEDEDLEAEAKRSRFRKRDSIGLYQDRKKSKLTFANAPDYVTFIPEEPFEEENNDGTFLQLILIKFEWNFVVCNEHF